MLTFSLPALEHTRLSSSTEILLFLAFTSAFAVKAPLFPFHTWSPDAYTEAPAGGSVVLSGVLAKLGTYGIIRFDLNLFPQATRTLAPLILTLAVIGIVYGAIVACAQRDMKRLVAYSSLAQIGFIALGTFALSTQGLSRGRAADAQPRPDRGLGSSSSSGSSTSAGARGRRPSCAACRRWPRSWRRCSPCS